MLRTVEVRPFVWRNPHLTPLQLETRFILGNLVAYFVGTFFFAGLNNG